MATIRGDENAILEPFLYHDIDTHKGTLLCELKDSTDPTIILSGAKAYERYTEETENNSNQRSRTDNEKSIIHTAVSQGLIDMLLPMLRPVSYGGGGQHAFMNKEGVILSAIIDSPNHDISALSVVDLHDRYARNNAVIAYAKFGINTEGVLGDFMENNRLAITKENGTPLVMIFGDTLLNIPSYKYKDAPTAEEKYKSYWRKMHNQHGLGSYVLLAVDTEQSTERLLEKERHTENQKAFLLSAFARAAAQGIIKNERYDIFGHWDTASKYDNQRDGVIQQSICKKSHILETLNGDFALEKGHAMGITLSYKKWTIKKHRNLIESENFRICHIFEQDNNPSKLILAQAVAKRPQFI